MKTTIITAKQNKLLISDYVDMYREGAKFFKYFGRALAYTEIGKYRYYISILFKLTHI